ncbi:MAG TPA: GtrA family protein [Solirubrobacteraceae bacterium]|nr:GtrA family protein [Solirubrobacteraceae bacterium]
METEPLTGPPALYRRLQGSRLIVKVTRYAIGSVVALLTSVIVFALLLDAGVGTTADSIVAFVAGALPNWILNRRWAWERTGDMDVAREVVGYALISLIALVASSAGTGWADASVRHHLNQHHAQRVMLVTLAYVVVQGLLFVVKFVAYDRWVFTDGGRFRAALTARRAAGLASPEPALESDSVA